jgi:micrococcal nuclease
VECFSRESSDFLRSRLTGNAIALTTDPSQDLRDRYGRLLAYVWLADGTLVNEAIVAGGYAHEYTYDSPYEFQGRIRRAETAARAAGRGLWAADACPATPPSAIGGPAPATLPASRSGAIALPAPTDAAQVPAAGGSDVVISDIFFDGVVPRVESDEHAVITNRGTEPVNLAGWRLNADDDFPNQNFVFPDIMLAPGESCHIYTNQDGAQPCHFSFGSGNAVWANDGECGHLFDSSGVEVSTLCYR